VLEPEAGDLGIGEVMFRTRSGRLKTKESLLYAPHALVKATQPVFRLMVCQSAPSYSVFRLRECVLGPEAGALGIGEVLF
jgi:hypothetical protein